MVNAARASVNRATARFILRSRSAGSKGSSTTPPSPRRAKISHHQLASVLPAILNRHKMQLESSVTSRKQTTAPNSNRHKFCPKSAPAFRAPAVTTHNSPLTTPISATDSSHPLFPNFLVATQILDLDLRRVMRACVRARLVSHLRRSGVSCDDSQAFRPGPAYAAPTALGLRARYATRRILRMTAETNATPTATAGGPVPQSRDGTAATNSTAGATAHSQEWLCHGARSGVRWYDAVS